MASIIRAEVTVPGSPDQAFDLFVNHIARWWRHGTPYWMDPDHAIEMRFEPHVGGRLIEVRDAAGEGLTVGRITAYEPGRRLAFTWRLPFWDLRADSDVGVTFEAIDEGTRVELTQDFRRAPAHLDDGRDYLGAWRTLLGFYASHAEK